MPKPLCDFCSCEEIGWVYPANDFQHSPLGESVGGWNACNTCHHFIQEGDRDALAMRSYERIKEHVKFPVELRMSLVKEIRELHDMFFAHQSALPRRVSGAYKSATL